MTSNIIVDLRTFSQTWQNICTSNSDQPYQLSKLIPSTRKSFCSASGGSPEPTMPLCVSLSSQKRHRGRGRGGPTGSGSPPVQGASQHDGGHLCRREVHEAEEGEEAAFVLPWDRAQNRVGESLHDNGKRKTLSLKTNWLLSTLQILQIIIQDA